MDTALVTDIQQKASGKSLADLPQIRTGMEVEVHQRIQEGSKSRIQIFKGLVIDTAGKSIGEKTFTVRRTSGDFGIEKVFPVACPTIKQIKIIREYKVRKKNIGFIRQLKGKAARLKEKVAIAPTKATKKPAKAVAKKPATKKTTTIKKPATKKV